MVANPNLAMAKHTRKHDVKVYQVTSSVVNPITIQEFIKIIFEHFKSNPYIDGKRNIVKLLKKLTYFNTMENYGQALDTPVSSPNNVSCSDY